MSIQTPIALEPKMLNFADIFTDGCDVKFVQGASCNVRAALPDGSLVDLSETYRGRLKPSDFHFEYGKEDCPEAAHKFCKPKPVWA
ncbi:hypothetical protein [Dongia sedimenti]|uniref:Uncharacterized protein n=1 Tax=Dongia sedimenti TaxID=3064282 RepID=A0ABU0YUW6_9PROT|nr:hypothetical protein [Rhodospirillaceae bacterium R-7]